MKNRFFKWENSQLYDQISIHSNSSSFGEYLLCARCRSKYWERNSEHNTQHSALTEFILYRGREELTFL